MQIWAHRGAGAYAPENTLEAFQKAVEMNADGVELDVQLTRDGKVVVIHDETLSRVSNGDGFVKDHTLEELKNLNFSRVMPEYDRTAVPTLREVLQLLRPTKLCINIELKTGRFFYQGIEEKVLELVVQYGMQERVWYSSFNHYTLRRIKELCTDAKCGVLYGDGIYDAAGYAKDLGMDALHPMIDNLQYPDLMRSCKEYGIKVHPWTANSYTDMEYCVRSGVNAMITNYPDKARLFAEKTEAGHYIFESPFEDEKEFYLFGAGYFGQHFIRRYQNKCRPVAVLDNGQKKWGSRVEGIEVVSPQCLKPGDRVVIASIYYAEIITQLQELGVRDYYVYDVQSTWE